MKKTKLIIECEYHFDLIGVSSSVKLYKLAWALNNQLQIRLVKTDDYDLEMKGGGSASFCHYHHRIEESAFDLFRNRSIEVERAYLIPELTHFDYIIKLTRNSQTFAKEVIIKELKEMKWIEYISPLEVEKLKSRDNFLN
ncbi:MAG: IPExxxVDY family protein [Bacteroidota bacterium]